MIVFQNSFITVTYTSEADILAVDWPDFEPYTVSEVKDSLNRLIEAMKNYDVKNLLIDASKANININYADYHAIISEFAGNLRKTRMQRVARIMSNDPEREANVRAVRQDNLLSYQFQDFKNKEEAIRWLTQK